MFDHEAAKQATGNKARLNRAAGGVKADAIAVVGLGCRFPGGASSPEAFWSLLTSGQSAIAEIPADRFSVDAFYDANPDALGRSTTKWGGFLDDIRSFDTGYFEISPREAQSMDPQQRMLLEVVTEALGDAGLTLPAVQAVPTGVFMGIVGSDYGALQRYQRTRTDVYAGPGSALSIAAARISHRLNLTGPATIVDTACSSSLVAVDQAVQNLLNGRCDIAIAGGANVLADPSTFIVFSKAGMMSTTGVISTFDKRANGYVRGEGVGAVILKRLADAERDGDPIHAVLRATCVNQDGHTSTLTAPSAEAQKAMLTELCVRGEIDPEAVDYVEAHGTGTPVGDPIEAHAIGSVFGRNRSGAPVLVGSVKPNIGHLESAAGISGLIKTILCVKKRQVPPNANFRDPNPNIPFDALNIAVPEALIDLPADRTALAVVNSFGFGGTNASAIVEGYPVAYDASAGGVETVEPGEDVVLQLSGASEKSLAENAAHLAEALATGELAEASLSDVALALSRRRDAKPMRAAVIAANRDQAVEQLQLVATGSVPLPARGQLPRVMAGSAKKARGKTTFTFAGQGGQWWGMARHLLETEGAFRTAFNAYDEIFVAQSGWSIREELLKDESQSRVNESVVAQPGIFGVQLGLAAYWESHGVRPDMVLGHSFGEAAAAYTSGALSLESSTRLIAIRSQIHAHVTVEGTMMAVGLSPEDLLAVVGPDIPIEIAAFNGPTMCTVSGPHEAIDAAQAAILAANPDTLARKLVTDTPWHSSALETAKDWFMSALGSVEHRVPHTPFISTVTGKPEVKLDLDYWWSNLRQPVRYFRAIDMALGLGSGTFIELSPHRVLSGLTSGIAAHRGADVVLANSLVRGEADPHALGVAASQLYCAGAVERTDDRRAPAPAHLKLPPYQWDRQEYWYEPEETRAALNDPKAHPLLGTHSRLPTFEWQNEFNLASDRYLTGHAVDGDVVFPGAGYLDMMLAAARDALGEGTIELTDVDILAAMFIRNEDQVLLHTWFDPESSRVEIRSRLRGGSDAWVLRARGRARLTDAPLVAPVAPLDEASAVGRTRAEFYARTVLHGLDYTGAFQGIESQKIAGRLCRAEISAPDSVVADIGKHMAHPAIFDALLQGAVGLDETEDGTYPLFLPVHFKTVRLAHRLPARFSVLAELLDRDQPKMLGAAYAAYDEAGALVLTIDGLDMRELDSRKASDQADEGTARHVIEDFAEQGLPEPVPGALDGSDWVVIGGAALGAALAGQLKAAGAQSCAMALEEVAGGDPAALADHAARWRALNGARCGVIFAEPALDFESAEQDGAEVASRVAALTNAQLAVGRAFKDLEESGLHPEMAVVTIRARALPGEAPSETGHAIAASQVGLMRTLANECPASRFISVDLGSPDETDAVMGLLASDTDESEWALRAGAGFVPRLRSVAPDRLPRRPVMLNLADRAANFEVTMAQPGSINAIALRQTDAPVCGPGEAVVRTRAVGLNFRDVMAVTGLLPAEAEPEPAWLNLGLEYAGEVEAVGPGVTNVAPGDKVMAMGIHCLQGRQVATAAGLIRLPKGLDFAEAATVPSVFATAHYALIHVARLAKGERVLIHLATGGVGLAAIQIAQAAGAEIFATAGNEEKRAHLRQMGIEHVFGSRSLQFADDILRATNGEGVDVVLNALPGPYIDKGIDLLRPFGRFLEIGKRDVYADTPIGMKALRNNLSFNVIDLAAMGRDRPDLMASLFDEVIADFDSGKLKPIRHTNFDISEIQEAFRTMSKARHIGKVVVGFDADEIAVPSRGNQTFTARADGVYLITGGSRGFGLAIAEWLSRSGAGEVALASRSGVIDDEAAPVVAGIEARGTIVSQHKVDMTDAAAVERLLQGLAGSGRALAGIVHGAAVIKDGFITQLTAETVDAVIRPKVAGAINLTRGLETLGLSPDFFVSFSSVAQMVGSIGQANYVAANAFLDGIAQVLKARGQAGVTIDWGALGESGFVARSDSMGRYLKSMGMEPVGDDEATLGLEQALGSDVAALAFARIDWSAIGRMFNETGVPPRLSGVVAAMEAGAHQIRADLAAAAQDDWPDMIAAFLIGEVTAVLTLDEGSVALDSALVELGFDSLSSIELKNRLEGQLGLSVSVGSFLSAATIGDLARLLVDALVEQVRAAESQAAVQAASDAGQEAEAETPQDLFQPAAHQRRALALSRAAMTTEAGRRALEHAGHIQLNEAVDIETLLTAWTALAELHPLLALSAGADGVTLAESAPVPTPVPDLPQSLEPDLDLESGDVLRPVFASGDGGPTELGLKWHESLGDKAALDRVLRDWAALAEGRAAPATVPRTELFAALALASGQSEDDATASSAAYWHEVQSPLISAAALPGRSLALAPVGFGLNRGETRRLSFAAPGSAAGEATWLRAFAEALAALAGTPDIVIARRLAGAGAVLPWPATVPVWLRGIGEDDAAVQLQLERQLDRATGHAGFDLAACEARFGGEYRAAGAVPDQFGFGFECEPGGAPLRPTCHDAALWLAAAEGGQLVELVFDTAALSEAEARALIADVVKRAGGKRPVKTAIKLDAPEPISAVPAPVRTAPHVARDGVELYPVIAPTRGVLSAMTRSGTTATFLNNWTVNQALLVQPGLDATRLKSAFDRLVARHETLHMRYVFDGDAVMAAVEPGLGGSLKVEDLGDVDRETMLAHVARAADAGIDLQVGPLFGVTLFKCGALGDVVLVHMSEFAGDGWSLSLIIDELIQTYLGVGQFTGSGTRYQDLLAATALPDDPDERAAIAQHWHEVLHPAVPMANFGRKAKGRPAAVLGAIAPFQRRSVVLAPEGLARLAERGARLGVNQNALIGAAVMRSVADWSGAETLFMGAVHPLRNNPALADKIGFVAGRLPVRCDVAEAGDLDGLARQIQTRFAENNRFAHPGLPFDAPATMPDGAPSAQSDWSLFGYGRMLPESFFKSSMAAPLVGGATSGARLSFAGFDLEALALKPYGLTRGDFNLRPMTTSTGVELNLFHDLMSLTSDEAGRFLDDICAHLELDAAQLGDHIVSDPVGDPDDLAQVEAGKMPKSRPLATGG